jgi:hypothetical protein
MALSNAPSIISVIVSKEALANAYALRTANNGGKITTSRTSQMLRAIVEDALDGKFPVVTDSLKKRGVMLHMGVSRELKERIRNNPFSLAMSTYCAHALESWMKHFPAPQELVETYLSKRTGYTENEILPLKQKIESLTALLETAKSEADTLRQELSETHARLESTLAKLETTQARLDSAQDTIVLMGRALAK